MNYEKCDFTPIIGADVKLKARDVLYYDGKLLGRQAGKGWDYDYLTILERASGGSCNYNAPTDRIISLKATMKPRDMNQEQLHRLASEIAIEHYGDRYESIRSIYHYFDEDGELNDISVDARCHLPDVGAFVIDPNEPVDITHWLKEDDHV